MKKGKVRNNEARKLKEKTGRLQNRVILALMIVLMMAVYPACGAASESMDMMVSQGTSSNGGSYYDGATGGGVFTESTQDYYAKVEEPTVEAGKTSADVVDNTVFDERKLIKTVDMTVETKEYDMLLTELKNQVSKLGGYIEHMDTYNGSSYSYYRSSRSANMTIRIPNDKLNEFVETVSGISNVVRRSDNVEDVTLSYVDMESRRNTLKTEQERLLALLAKAESIEDIITIEDRLSTVRYQLESMESQLRTIDNQVDYSTVYLNIDEVQELTPVEVQTPVERIGEGFADSLHDIGDGAVEFAVWFVVNIPYFVVWAVIITAIVVIIRVCRKKSKEKKAKKLEAAYTGAQMSQNPIEKKDE